MPLTEDPRFLTKADRVANNKALVALLQERFITATSQEWFEKLDAVGIPAGPVQYHDEVFHDPHVMAREMVVEVDHPAAGRHRTLGTPIKLSDTPGSIRRPAPMLGEHTEEVLAELRLKDEAAD